MDLWHVKATKALTDFMQNTLAIEKINFTGSILDQNSLDIFSDVDMEIFLQENSDFNIKKYIQILSEEFSIFGYEIISHENHDLLRVCFETGWRFDISLFYKKKESLQVENFTDKIACVINQFWFMSFMILVKFGRNDFLVATHLALELCQLIIVIQMLLRDNTKKTNVHRFGNKENVPIFVSLLSINNNDSLSDSILNVLFLAAEYMDKASESLDLGYTRRSDKLKAIYQGLTTP